MLGMARNAWGFARIGEIGERVWRTWIIYIFNQKNNDNKTERGTFGAINSPKNSKSRWEIQKKLLEYLEQLQKEETMEILLENSNIKKVIKKIDEERGIWMPLHIIHKEIDKFFIK